MNFSAPRAQFIHERHFVEALVSSCERLGHRRVEEGGDFCIQWGAHTANEIPTLHCELGWLPRWSYQVSWGGINAAHDHAGEQADKPKRPHLVNTHLRRVKSGIGMPAGGWGYCDPTVTPYSHLRVDYLLCPLQVPEDTNMAHLPPILRTPQGLIDYVTSKDWGAPIYFKQHPARSELFRPLQLKPPHKIIPHRAAQIAALLKSPHCQGVIAGNSNVVHDAILFDKHVRALGAGFWGPPREFEPGTPETLAYVEHLKAHQWILGKILKARTRRLLEEMP